ncbi:MAG: hypothetical protein ACT4P7_21860 [Gemmatimonadaceae bacterium]
MPATERAYYTVDEVLAFPDDGNRYELVYGELLLSPTPRVAHQRVVMDLVMSASHGLTPVRRLRFSNRLLRAFPESTSEETVRFATK